jgi:hypothetical protein
MASRAKVPHCADLAGVMKDKVRRLILANYDKSMLKINAIIVP